MSFNANNARPHESARPVSSSGGTSETGNELRHHRRARSAWPARILNGAGQIVSVTVCDVSEGGVGLLGQANPPLGTLLDVTMSVPGSTQPQRMHAVTAKVRVVFCSLVGAQCRLGVQFVDLPMAARIAIRSYVFANS